MSISIYFRTWWRGHLIGIDGQGNRYYEDRKKPPTGMQRRWVIYKGHAEASKIPSQWHGWLHYSTSTLPSVESRFTWEKDHLPNLTGTPQAYMPEGLRGIALQKDYEAWVPPAG